MNYPDKLLRVSTVCEQLACSESWAYHLIAVGELKIVRIGRRRGYRVPQGSVDAYLQRQIDKFYAEDG